MIRNVPNHSAGITFDRGPDLDLLVQSLHSVSDSMSSRERVAMACLLELAGQDRLDILGVLEPQQLLSPAEREIFETVSASNVRVEAHVSRQLVVVMKATRLCNLRCTYCHSWREGPNQVMPFAVLCQAIKGALTVEGAEVVEFVWHGGEVTLLPRDFFRKAVWLQQRLRRPGQRIQNSVQTNATNINEPLLRFFCDYGFAIGISIDGPPELHDRFRIDKAGRPTSAAVQKGLRWLQAIGLKPAVLVVVGEATLALGARRMLDYLLELGIETVGFLNVIPSNTAPARTEDYIAWEQYVGYLRELFKIWHPGYRDRISIREFDSLLNTLQGNGPNLCYFAGDCMGRFVTVEPDGEVTACDKYVGDQEFRFGNLLSAPLAALLTDSQALLHQIARQKAGLVRMKGCQWFSVCQGGCPHDRRLNALYQHGFREDCCGYSSLIEEMAAVLHDGV